MTERKRQQDKPLTEISSVAHVFLGSNLFLKKILKRFLYQDEDIEGVVQETYIKACQAETIHDLDYKRCYPT